MKIALMLEGQDGLNWGRWQRILQAAEDLGYHGVFRSDHFTNASAPDKDSLELWVSLTYAASHTQRIEFGQLVSPTTFRHPAMTVRMAAAVDDLSGGRLTLGLGAGWQNREHYKFGVPFYDFPTRFEMLEDALEITTRLLRTPGPVSYTGKHFSLEEAELLPHPQRAGGPPILIGGNGPKRTLPLTAKYADEWNAVFIPAATIKERSAELDRLLIENGRQPGDVKRSLMTGTRLAQTDADIPANLPDLRERGLIAGTPSMWVDQLGELAELGLERVMLQWLALDDLDGIERVAKDVLPHFHK